METPFVIEMRVGARQLKLTLRGFWSPEIMAAFERELDQAVVNLRTAGLADGCFDVIVDLSDHPVQSQQVADRLRSVTERMQSKPRRTANILSDRALQQLQVKRIISDTPSRMFTNEADAMSWLKE